MRDPIPTLDAIDRAMRNHAGDPERFNDICLARERVHHECEDIAESVAAFLRGALAPSHRAVSP